MQKINDLLSKIINKEKTDAILLSGGLNSSILASVIKKNKLNAYTIVATKNSPDYKYAKIISKKFNLEQNTRTLTAKEIIKEIPNLIKIIRSFDPQEVKNALIPYFGLKEAKDCKIILSGEGANEVFLGYPYLFHKSRDELKKYLDYTTKVGVYQISKLAKAFSKKVITPYIDKEIIEYAKNINIDQFIKKRERKIYGKWILRKSFEKLLPKEVIWRPKTTIEESTGIAVIKQYIDDILPIEEYEDQKDEIYATDNVELKSNEQYFYYKIYKRFFGPPFATHPQKKHCPYCKSDIIYSSLKYCPTCGAFLV